jgi:hypothetical protein
MSTTVEATAEKQIKLELLQLASAMANSQWNEGNTKIKYEAEKNGKTEYTLLPDNRVQQTIIIARKLQRFIEATGTPSF